MPPWAVKIRSTLIDCLLRVTPPDETPRPNLQSMLHEDVGTFDDSVVIWAVLGGFSEWPAVGSSVYHPRPMDRIC